MHTAQNTTTQIPEQDPTILIRENRPESRYRWRQYFVITDRREVMIELVPAAWHGWNFHCIDVRGEADCGTLSRDELVAWKFRHCSDGLTRLATLDDRQRAQLVEIARNGALPERRAS